MATKRKAIPAPPQFTIQSMSLGERIGWATGILVLDLVVFFLPLTAITLFVMILRRPDFLKNFVDRLYAEPNGKE